MKFSLSKKNKQTDSTALILDFGTSSVKILVCSYSNDIMEILGGKKVSYPKEAYDGEGNLKIEIIEPAIKVGIDALTKELQLPPISSAAVGISNNMVEGYSSKITYRRANADRKISEQEYGNILKLVESRADQIMRRMISWETGGREQAALISSEILDLALDGYAVTSVAGSTGAKLEFTVYNGYAEHALSHSIVSMLKRLGLDVKVTTSTMYSILRNTADAFGPDSSALVIDVGDKVTEIGLIAGGRIMGHVPFDVAGASFTKNIAEALGRQEEDAAMLKLGFTAGKIPRNLSDEIHEQVANDCKVFVSGVELVLSEFPGVQIVPSLVLLCGGGSLLPGILSSLQADEWKDTPSKSKSVRAQYLKPEHLKRFTDATQKMSSPADCGPLCIALDSTDLFL